MFPSKDEFCFTCLPMGSRSFDHTIPYLTSMRRVFCSTFNSCTKSSCTCWSCDEKKHFLVSFYVMKLMLETFYPKGVRFSSKMKPETYPSFLLHKYVCKTFYPGSVKAFFVRVFVNAYVRVLVCSLSPEGRNSLYIWYSSAKADRPRIVWKNTLKEIWKLHILLHVCSIFFWYVIYSRSIEIYSPNKLF